MVIMSGLSLSVEVIRQYFVGALDLIVQSERLPDGKRKLVSVAEVVDRGNVAEVVDRGNYD